MRSPHFLASSALAPAAAAALGAGLLYLLIARMVEPDSLHFGAAIVIGMTLGIHVYRRARLRIATQAHGRENIST